MNKKYKYVHTTSFVVIALCMFIISSALYVLALPTGPSTITQITTSRFPQVSPSNVSAQAGNVTQINFGADGVTQTWQGYYGNISGTIVLGNSNNQTLYDWNSASPTGEIYATRTASTPNWASIACANVTHIDAEDASLGTSASDVDRVNRTFFNTTSFNTFYVGSTTINQSSMDCYATHLYNNTGSQSTYFPEVLLSDGSAFIYAALLESDVIGFNGQTHDFQMLVGEDGHSGDTSTTTYYFYLELG